MLPWIYQTAVVGKNAEYAEKRGQRAKREVKREGRTERRVGRASSTAPITIARDPKTTSSRAQRYMDRYESMRKVRTASRMVTLMKGKPKQGDDAVGHVSFKARASSTALPPLFSAPSSNHIRPSRNPPRMRSKLFNSRHHERPPSKLHTRLDALHQRLLALLLHQVWHGLESDQGLLSSVASSHDLPLGGCYLGLGGC